MTKKEHPGIFTGLLDLVKSDDFPELATADRLKELEEAIIKNNDRILEMEMKISTLSARLPK